MRNAFDVRYLRPLIDELYAKVAAAVSFASSEVKQVFGTAPIVITGTVANPNVTITPATEAASGSMSAADKTKLDNLIAAENGGVPVAGGPFTTVNALGTLTATNGGAGVLDLTASGGGGVTAVTGTAPIVSSGGDTPAISYTPPVHEWADSAGGAVDTGIQTNMVQVSFTPGTYTSARVDITGIIENASTTTAALFLLSVGLAIAPTLPSVVYTGDPNGLVVPHEVAEVLGTVQFAMVYTAHGLVPGTTYTICAFGEAAGVNLAVAAHGVQIDVSEVAP